MWFFDFEIIYFRKSTTKLIRGEVSHFHDLDPEKQR